MVSVCCRTYNHVSYIRNALDGFLKQDTNFLYKVIVFDDASTDGTSDIVREYAEKYSDIIQAVIMKKNTWHNPARAKIDAGFMKKYLKGKYIAYCEGDDFWIDSHKLQIQVDYMESHSECSLYLHNALWFNCQNSMMRAGNPYDCKNEKEVSPEEIIMMYNGHPPTASILHRKDLLKRPQFFDEASVGDYTLLLYALFCGSIHYNSRIMSVYREMAIGSHGRALRSDLYLQFYHYFGISQFCIKYNKYTNYKFEKWCNAMIQGYTFPIIHDKKWRMVIDNYIKECMKCGYIFSEDYSEYANEFIRLQKQIYDKTFISPGLRNFIDQFKDIVIMGAGNYAKILAEQFLHNGIEYGGFVVSNKKEGEDDYLEKSVWQLSELPYNRESTGIVIGINPVDWSDIKNSLICANISNYYCPFLLNVDARF